MPDKTFGPLLLLEKVITSGTTLFSEGAIIIFNDHWGATKMSMIQCYRYPLS